MPARNHSNRFALNFALTTYKPQKVPKSIVIRTNGYSEISRKNHYCAANSVQRSEICHNASPMLNYRV